MIEINNLTDFSVDKKLFLGIAKKVLKEENKGMENLSVAFVGTEEMKKLNKKYRGKNKSTDVLSFEREKSLKDDFSEVVICPSFVKEYSKASKLSLKKELAKVLIHGILHTLGYDHERSKKEEIVMFRKQDYYLSKIKQLF